MARTDWYAYEYDRFGTSYKRELRNRSTPVKFIREMKEDYSINNEIMFRRGISSDKFIGISCDVGMLRQRLISKYKAAGVTNINGKPIEEFIKVSQTIGE